jgi:hypothetical protein
MHALISTGVAESQQAKVVLRKSADGCLGEETAMLIEERSCAVQAVDAFRLMHLPALEVQAVRFLFLIISHYLYLIDLSVVPERFGQEEKQQLLLLLNHTSAFNLGSIKSLLLATVLPTVT